MVCMRTKVVLILFGWFLMTSQAVNAMYRTTAHHTLQKIPAAGQAIFTGSLPCLMAYAKKDQNNFFLLTQFTDPNPKQVFEFSENVQDMPFHNLLDRLFPGVGRKRFTFESDKRNEYNQLIDTINDQALVTWWTNKKTYYEQFKNMNVRTGLAIKGYLKNTIAAFATKINRLVRISQLATPMNVVKLVARTAVNDTAKSNLIENGLEAALFNNFDQTYINRFLTPTQVTVNQQEINTVKELVRAIINAQFCYVVDLAEADVTTALPRAIYQEIEKLAQGLGVKAPSFGPYIFSTQFAKALAVIGSSVASGAFLYSRFYGGNK